MVENLIIVEEGIEFKSWRNRSGLSGLVNCTVLVEDVRSVGQIDDTEANYTSIDEKISQNSAIGSILYRQALNLVEFAATTTPFIDIAPSLGYDDLSLWEMGSYVAERLFWKVLRRIETLKSLCKSHEWDAIYIVENQLGLRDTLTFVLDDLGTKSEIVRVTTGGSRNYGRRLYERLPGWTRQLARDSSYAIRSRPLPRLSQSVNNGSTADYLFLTHGYATYFNTAIPVVEKASEKHEVSIINTGGVINSPRLTSAGIELSYCSQFVPISGWSRIAKQSSIVKKAWDSLSSDPRIVDVFTYSERSLWPLIKLELHRHFLDLYPRIMTWIEALKNIYEASPPKAVVVVPDRHPTSRVALTLARNFSLPTLTIQPGLIADNPSNGQMTADKIAAIDHFSSRIYVERGNVRPNQSEVTGLPRWDPLARKISDFDREAADLDIRVSLGIGPADKLIVFASQHISITYTRRLLDAIVGALSACAPDSYLVVKIHPAESLSYYKSQLGNLEWPIERLSCIKDIDLISLLSASNVLVTAYSNVALEAALLDRPVLIVNLTGEVDPLPFVMNGIALGAYNELEIKEQLDKILNLPSGPEDLTASRHHYFLNNPQLSDGRATDRVVEMLHHLHYQNDSVLSTLNKAQADT